MIERHPAGRSCALVLLAAGVLTATGLTGLFALSTAGGPAVPANAPAAVVQTLAPTTTPAVTTTPAATTTAPVAAPRALVAEPTTTTEDPTVPVNPAPATDANGVRVAPSSNPNANKTPDPIGAENGWDPTGNDGKGAPVGPDPATVPTR
jgi:hypothetical protein